MLILGQLLGFGVWRGGGGGGPGSVKTAATTKHRVGRVQPFSLSSIMSSPHGNDVRCHIVHEVTAAGMHNPKAGCMPAPAVPMPCRKEVLLNLN